MNINSHRTQHSINLHGVDAHVNVTIFFDAINRPEVHIATESDDEPIVVCMDGCLLVDRMGCSVLAASRPLGDQVADRRSLPAPRPAG